MKILQQLYDLKQKHPKEWELADRINEWEYYCAKCYGMLWTRDGGHWGVDILVCDICKTERDSDNPEGKDLEYIELYKHIITKQ